MKINRFFLIGIAVIAVIALVWVIRPFGNEAAAEHSAHETAGHEEHEEHGEHESPAISGLVVEPAVSGESWDVINATGKVGPNTNGVVKIGPRIAGKIVRVYANVGDVVSRGQTLATISSVELAQARASYRQALARMKAAEQAYNQQVKLAKLGAFTGRPMEEARSEHVTAQGDLAQAKSEVAQYKSELLRAESELVQCAARLSRARELYKDEIISRQDLESAEAEYKRDSAEVEAAKSKIRQAEAKVTQAESRTGIAKSYLDREKKIHSSNILATREIQQAKSALTAARLEVQAAADAIRVLGASPKGSGDTLAITSPISGRVVERSVNLGEMAEPSTTLFTVMNLSDVWVEASVYEKDIARVRKGQSVEIRVNSYADKVFSGKVTHVSDVLDPASRTARVRCAVSNSNGMLKPEMFASISIVTAKRPNAVLVPREAVLDDGGKKIVFTVCRECAEVDYEKAEVTTGPSHGDKIEVLSGLEAGTEVVTVGAFQLKTSLGSSKPKAGCVDMECQD